MSQAPGFTRCYGWVRVAHLFSFLCCVVCPLLSTSLDCSLLIADSVCLTTASFYNSYYLLKCRKLSYCFLNDPTLTDFLYQQQDNIIGGVMDSVLASSAADRGFEPRSGQTKDYNIGICCYSARNAISRRKNIPDSG